MPTKLVKSDKLLHFFVAGWAYMLLTTWIEDLPSAFIVGFLIIAKEAIWDHLLKKGTPEFLDIVFGLIGLATVVVIDNYSSILQHIVNY